MGKYFILGDYSYDREKLRTAQLKIELCCFYMNTLKKE